MNFPRIAAGLALAALLRLAPAGAAEPMTYEEYGRVRHAYPYVFELTHGKGALLVFGAAHTTDPSDPQVARIAELWRKFRPTLALNEGGDPPALADAAEAVRRFAEGGFLRHLAARDGVPVRTFEPALAEEAGALRARFSEERIKLFYALRQAAQYRRQKNDTPVEEFIGFVLDYYLGRQAGLQGPPRNAAELEQSCARHFPALLDWREVPAEWFDPTRPLYFTNEIARETGHFRDRHIVRLLVDEVKKGERVFVVIGGTHAVMQERALASALARDRLVTIDTRPGVTTSFYFMKREGAKAAVILLPGGAGTIGFKGGAPTSTNFVVRSRDLFAGRGLHVAVLGRPSDVEDMDGSFRVSPAHLEDLRRVVAWLRRELGAAVWLVGTSRGSVSATAAAIGLGGRELAGVVLTSSVTNGKLRGAAVLEQDLEAIRIPVLVVHHQDDACRFCPVHEALEIAPRLSGAPVKKAVIVSGGAEPRGDPCEPLHHHGFVGIEREVVDLVAAWIAQPAP